MTGEKKRRKLTGKQRKFIDEYFVDFNATRAAQRARYKGNENTLAATGSRLLRNVKVAEVISERLKESAMCADEVLSRLAEQARGEHRNYMQEDGSLDVGRLVKDGMAHLIKAIRPGRKGTIYEFHDQQRALELIGKHHGIFNDKSEQQAVNVGVNVYLPENKRDEE
jgi:phage terminase small subunit